jgi:hypothetical protein
MDDLTSYTAFLGWERIASGSLAQMLRDTRARVDNSTDGAGQLLIFEDSTGKQVDFDLRGPIEEVIERAEPKPVRTGPGRPRLGVTSREISLLPRHWEWLETQPNGASAALRRLVEEARKRDGGEARTRPMIEATGRFMTAIAGDLTGFEEAFRALYARDRASLGNRVKDWPEDVRNYVIARFDQALSSLPL